MFEILNPFVCCCWHDDDINDNTTEGNQENVNMEDTQFSSSINLQNNEKL